jgi:hypothetical protein
MIAMNSEAEAEAEAEAADYNATTRAYVKQQLETDENAAGDGSPLGGYGVQTSWKPTTKVSIMTAL